MIYCFCDYNLQSCKSVTYNVTRFWEYSIQSKLHIRQNETNYHTTSADLQHYSNYSRLLLTGMFSGRCGRLEWQCLAL